MRANVLILLGLESRGTRFQVSAAIGTYPVQGLVIAISTERAFIRAKHRPF
jgi:hypothetical protein